MLLEPENSEETSYFLNIYLSYKCLRRNMMPFGSYMLKNFLILLDIIFKGKCAKLANTVELFWVPLGPNFMFSFVSSPLPLLM